MTKFNRKFDVDRIGKIETPENAWFLDLLGYWYPAGEAKGGRDAQTAPEAPADHLRLAVRDGYLNFYRAGQSVAKVSFAKGKLQGMIHNKYVFGNDGSGDKYVKITDGTFENRDALRIPYRDGLVRDWIMKANEYTKSEKRFVDDLLSQNPGVVDLEAGLPWDSDIWSKKSARRIDLVALEGSGDRYKLVFWEAKLVTNSEARSNTEPKVIGQLKDYKVWLEKHQDDVRAAYQYTCAALVRLNAIAKARNPNRCELGDAIFAVAGQDASHLDVDIRPRLIIDATKENAAFIDNGHLDKLRHDGIDVQLIRGTSDMALRTRV
ncbi:MAG: hypothetical protein LLG20_06740 [Acidobacteriales bacterium]|nr:hypothetical protein [Terriglobales bacterium]